MTTDPVDAPLEPADIEIHFFNGAPSSLKDLKNNNTRDNPLDIIDYLNEIGGKHGIGRIDIVENRFIGLKVIKMFPLNTNSNVFLSSYRIIFNSIIQFFFCNQSRGIYESPGAKILHEAHLDLEVYLLDREVLRVKSYLADKMTDYVYNGK